MIIVSSAATHKKVGPHHRYTATVTLPCITRANENRNVSHWRVGVCNCMAVNLFCAML